MYLIYHLHSFIGLLELRYGCVLLFQPLLEQVYILLRISDAGITIFIIAATIGCRRRI